MNAEADCCKLLLALDPIVTGKPPYVASSREKLIAKAYRSSGQHDQDVLLHTRLVEETLDEGDHRERVTALLALSTAFYIAGRSIEATPHVEQALLANERLSPSDPARLWAMLTMVRCYTKSKRYEDARDLQATLVELARTRFGPNHPRVFSAVEKLRFLEELLPAQVTSDRAKP